MFMDASLPVTNAKHQNDSGYMPQLDALRALAVAAVVYSHWIPFKYQFGFQFGHLGVQCFFMLSGFLITGILLRCRHANNHWFALKAFYARRFLRIFPLYYLVIFLLCIFQYISVSDAFSWHIPYLSNVKFFLQQSWPGSISHFWSLAVEEQFYLFWPLVMLFIPKRSILKSILLLIAIGALAQFLPVIYPDLRLLGLLLVSNFDALGLGAFLAFTKSRTDIPTKWISFLALTVPLFLTTYVLRVVGVSLPFHYQLEHFSMLLALLWLIEKSARGFSGSVGQFLTMPPLLYLGRISYGLYVIHNFAGYPVAYFCDAIGMPLLRFGVTGILLKATATILLASLSWHFFEAPLNSLKSRFPYNSKKARSARPSVSTIGNHRRLAA
jgi:peptidoglycan/LPS O-acetylase OafA/YrhL